MVENSKIRDLGSGRAVRNPDSLTTEDATATSGTDATVVDNIRTRVGEIETVLKALGIVQ